MIEILSIGIGGFLGANARYLLSLWCAERFGPSFPYGTLIINVSGSFVLGVIVGAADVRSVSPLFRLATGVGFLGAYTTFSTFTVETIRMIEAGSFFLALVNVVGSVAIGLAAALLGIALARAF
ncbi:MAG TPA: fluoride efflux transporter CrcB [Candidatus Binatia bacterium]|nr:fluoride efflux transporter CrcB [Candidatus Binatia bacterium]